MSFLLVPQRSPRAEDEQANTRALSPTPGVRASLVRSLQEEARG